MNWKKDEFMSASLSSFALRIFYISHCFRLWEQTACSTHHRLVHDFKTLKMPTLLQTVLLGNDPAVLNIQP